jgi:hypothetical protein
MDSGDIDLGDAAGSDGASLAILFIFARDVF